MEINLWLVQDWNAGSFHGSVIGVFTSQELAIEAKAEYHTRRIQYAPAHLLSRIDISPIVSNRVE